MSNKTAKQKYFDKVYENAPLIPCGCGCGQETKSKDKYGRNRKFINGHNGRKYDNPTQFKREWNHRNREQRYLYKRKWLKNLKIDLILYKGGKCNHCGYTLNEENQQAFDFHHINPSDKLFVISSSLGNVSLKEIYLEVDKCELLCAICHRLHHSKNE